VGKLPTYTQNVQPEAVSGTMGEVLGTTGSYIGQCVTYVKRFYPEIRGNAIDIQPNTDTPSIGALVLTTESYFGHVALISDIQNGNLILSESNYNWDGLITNGRELATSSPYIRGYYSSTSTPAFFVVE